MVKNCHDCLLSYYDKNYNLCCTLYQPDETHFLIEPHNIKCPKEVDLK